MPYPNKDFLDNYKTNDGSRGGSVKKMSLPNDMGVQTKTNMNKPSPKKPGVVLSGR